MEYIRDILLAAAPARLGLDSMYTYASFSEPSSMMHAPS